MKSQFMTLSVGYDTDEEVLFDIIANLYKA